MFSFHFLPQIFWTHTSYIYPSRAESQPQDTLDLSTVSWWELP